MQTMPTHEPGCLPDELRVLSTRNAKVTCSFPCRAVPGLMVTKGASPRGPARRSVLFHLRTLWLFTVSDHKPLVYPMTLTGLLNLLSGPALNTILLPQPTVFDVVCRLPAVIFWVWLNFLVFCVGNQRLSESLVEDAVNKPWRPIPAGRLTQSQAMALWITLHVVVLGACAHFGATRYTISLLVLGYLYNNLGGGNHPLFRNAINAYAVVCFALGATEAAYGSRAFMLSDKGVEWHWMIWAIVFTTLQVQDLCDQEGDKERGRSTIPLIFGDGVARWSVVAPTMIWSLVVPSFWTLPWYGYIGPLAVGGNICMRALTMKTVAADRKTYKMWGLWISCILAVVVMT